MGSLGLTGTTRGSAPSPDRTRERNGIRWWWDCPGQVLTMDPIFLLILLLLILRIL